MLKSGTGSTHCSNFAISCRVVVVSSPAINDGTIVMCGFDRIDAISETACFK